jgi:hypothetical protein
MAFKAAPLVVAQPAALGMAARKSCHEAQALDHASTTEGHHESAACRRSGNSEPVMDLRQIRNERSTEQEMECNGSGYFRDGPSA